MCQFILRIKRSTFTSSLCSLSIPQYSAVPSYCSIRNRLAREKVNFLGLSELKWTGMSEFNSDDHYIYYCWQESLRRNAVAIVVNRRVQSAVLGYNLKNNRIISVRFQGKPFKNDRMISVHFQGKPFSITVIQAYAPTRNAEEAEVERFYEDLQDL